MTRFTKSGVQVASPSFAGGVKVYARLVFFYGFYFSGHIEACESFVSSAQT